MSVHPPIWWLVLRLVLVLLQLKQQVKVLLQELGQLLLLVFKVLLELVRPLALVRPLRLAHLP